MTRLVIDGARKQKREVLSSGDDDLFASEQMATDAAADDLLVAEELATKVKRELARLPEAQRVAFRMVREEGLSLAEAAAALGTTVAAVKLRAHRAYEALRAVLEIGAPR